MLELIAHISSLPCLQHPSNVLHLLPPHRVCTEPLGMKLLCPHPRRGRVSNSPPSPWWHPWSITRSILPHHTIYIVLHSCILLHPCSVGTLRMVGSTGTRRLRRDVVLHISHTGFLM